MFPVDSSSSLECLVSPSEKVCDNYAYLSNELWDAVLFLSGQGHSTSVSKMALAFTTSLHHRNNSRIILWAKPANIKHTVGLNHILSLSF